MNFITFPVSTTTIFPMSNSNKGGQLVTERTLRLRDSISTNPEISYFSCPSYTHSSDDFLVRIQQDESGSITSSSTLEILSGKAIINGHYVENTESMSVNLVEANNELVANSMTPLTGNLAIGLRIYYSTSETMIGDTETGKSTGSSVYAEEDDTEMFTGVQIVVLPENELITPDDSPSDINKVNCHLKLATFDFISNAISNVVNNDKKTQYISGNRIEDINSIISDSYVSSQGLNPKQLYVYAGKGTSTNDTWCKSTDSLMVWDANPTRTTNKPTERQAYFVSDPNTEETKLIVPHKQVDGMKNSAGQSEYYKSIVLTMPQANYLTNTPGTVTSSYTKSVKNVENKFNNFYRVPGKSKQIGFDYEAQMKQYIPIYDPAGETDGTTFASLPKIQDKWRIGDYVLVGEDRSFQSATDESTTEESQSVASYPSTYYCIIPGKVKNYAYYGVSKPDSEEIDTTSIQDTSAKFDGVELMRIEWSGDSAPDSTIKVSASQPDSLVTLGTQHPYLVPDENGNLVTLSFPTYSGGSSYNATSAGRVDNFPSSNYSDVTLNEDFVDRKTGLFKNLPNQDIIDALVEDDLSYVDNVISQINEVQNVINSDISNGSIKSVAEEIKTNMSTIISLSDQINTDAGNISTYASSTYASANDISNQAAILADQANASASKVLAAKIDELSAGGGGEDAGGGGGSSSGGSSDDGGKGPGYHTSNPASVKKTQAQIASDLAIQPLGSDPDIVDKKIVIGGDEDDEGDDSSEVSDEVDSILSTVNQANEILNAAGRAIYGYADSIKDAANRVINYSENISSTASDASGNADELIDYIDQVQSAVTIITSDIKNINDLLKNYQMALKSTAANDVNRVMNMRASYIYRASKTNVMIDDYDKYNGKVGSDYFTISYTAADKNGENHTYLYFYIVADSEPNTWSEPSRITAPTPYADTDTVGGFKNIDGSDSNYIDGGYIIRNDDGYLQLVDYSLLRSGVGAYQLGQDLTFDSGASVADIQAFLNDYVNDRVAFPNNSQLANSTTPNIINITITLPIGADDATNHLVIKNIDSRFNTSVYFHFLVSSNEDSESAEQTTGITIDILDCQKIRIDNSIPGSPIINVYRSCLYYDPQVINYVLRCNRASSSFTGFQDMSIWYQIYEATDPQLVVDHMTVSQINTPVITEDLDYWNLTTPNDSHYLVGLNSLTFAGDGTLIRCGLLVANQSTDNVQTGQKLVVGKFILPQGSGLNYPEASLAKQMKITGTFTTGYYTSGAWLISTTSFSALTQSYDTDLTVTNTGTIAFNTNTALVHSDLGQSMEEGGIAPFETDTYNIFNGGVIS